MGLLFNMETKKVIISSRKSPKRACIISTNEVNIQDTKWEDLNLEEVNWEDVKLGDLNLPDLNGQNGALGCCSKEYSCLCQWNLISWILVSLLVTSVGGIIYFLYNIKDIHSRKKGYF